MPLTNLIMFKKITGSFILALQNIRSNFFHTILSITGIVIGVASLVSILSLIDGMEKFAQDEITKTTSLKAITVGTSSSKNVNGVWVRKDTVTYMTPEDFANLKAAITLPVTGLLWQIQGKEMLIEGDSLKTAANTTAVSEFDTTFHLVYGTMISPSDFSNRATKAVVSEELAQILADKKEISDIIGKQIVFGERKLELVGVIKSSRVKRPQLFFPITLFTAAECKANPPQSMFEAVHVTDVSKIKDQIQAWVNKKYGTKNDFVISTNEFRVAQAARGFKLFRIIMGLIVGISVLVGGCNERATHFRH
jgi:putative ABC transport system permease protein